MTAFTVPVLLLAALAFQTPSQKAEPSDRKEAWQWSLDERLAARQTLSEAQPEYPSTGVGSSATFKGPKLDGSKSPELLLPGELFRQLLSLGFVPSAEARRIFRTNIMAGASHLRLPPDFWEQLEVISGDYLHAHEEARKLGVELRRAGAAERSRILSRLEEVQGLQCGLRYMALRAVRSSFGAKLFDRFLYEAVAPLTQITLTAPQTRDRLAWAEEGCR